MKEMFIEQIKMNDKLLKEAIKKQHENIQLQKYLSEQEPQFNQQIQNLKNKNQELYQQLDKLSNEMKEQRFEQYYYVYNKIEEYQQKCQQTVQQIADTEQNNQQLQQQLEKRDIQLKQQSKNVQQIRDQINIQQKMKDNLKQQIKDLIKQNNKLIDEYKDLLKQNLKQNTQKISINTNIDYSDTYKVIQDIITEFQQCIQNKGIQNEKYIDLLYLLIQMKQQYQSDEYQLAIVYLWYIHDQLTQQQIQRLKLVQTQNQPENLMQFVTQLIQLEDYTKQQFKNKIFDLTKMEYDELKFILLQDYEKLKQDIEFLQENGQPDNIKLLEQQIQQLKSDIDQLKQEQSSKQQQNEIINFANYIIKQSQQFVQQMETEQDIKLKKNQIINYDALIQNLKNQHQNPTENNLNYLQRIQLPESKEIQQYVHLSDFLLYKLL